MTIGQITPLIILAASLLTLQAKAQVTSPTCTGLAIEKKLSGAAKNSFLKKCERDAYERCEAAAAERKLSGAAKKSNVTKCTKDSVGT